MPSTASRRLAFSLSYGLLLSAGLCGNAVRAADYYVSPKGADGNDGARPDRAFNTIQKAADVATAGDTVHIAGGVYRETVRPAHSGQEGKPITFQPSDGETAVVSGADAITGWQPAGEQGVYRAPMPGDFFVSKMNQADQVFVDGKMAALARWPNPSGDPSRPAKARVTKFVSKAHDEKAHWWTVVFEDDKLEPKADGFYDGAEIYVQPNAAGWGWTLSGVVVEHKGNRLAVHTRSGSGEDGKQDQWAVGARYYLYNKRQLLDADGEWFHDKAAGALLLRASGGQGPSDHRVEAKRRDYGFDLTDRSYITLRGLHLFACSVTTDNASLGDGVPYGPDGSERHPWRAGDFVAPAHHVTLDGLDATYLNHFTDVSGHFFLHWPMNTGLVLAGSDHVVRHCRIQYAAGNGISLQGWRHKCLENVILDTNYQSTDCAPVSTGTATPTRDVEIAHNTIDRTARSGMTLRNLMNSDLKHLVTRVHHNDVANYGLQDWDLGAFYVAGQDGTFVRIDHNWFHCDEPREGMVFGAYWDYSKNYVLDHNVIWGVPNPIQVTRNYEKGEKKVSNLLIYNNTVLTNHATWSSCFVSSEDNGTLVQNNLIEAAGFRDPRGTLVLRWPNYGSEDVTVVKNVLWGAPARPGWTEGKKGPTDLTADDPKFVRPAAHDYRIRPDSPAAGAGAAVEAVTRDGVTVPPYDGPATGRGVDAGAYEVGGEDWKPGSSPAQPAGQ